MRFLAAFLIVFGSMVAFGQTTYDVTAGGGNITGHPVGRNNLSGSPTVIAVSINGGTPEFESGTVAFTTGNRATGTLQTGATLSAGGSFSVTTANEGNIFAGNFSSATWTVVFLANGTHFYNLTGSVQDTFGNTGSFILTTKTATSLTCFFSGSEVINTVNVNITIN